MSRKRGRGTVGSFCVFWKKSANPCRWWTFDSLPASDSVFNLPILSLRKLKPYRDLLYLKSTLPDLDTFGLAYRAIKLWAVQRGIYSSKFGFLGGVHITLMLSWVYKRVSLDDSTGEPRTVVSASDLVATFFHYYANYNWAGDMVFDAFFNKQRPRYHRSAREPMVVLGFHAPNSNIAHTSTLPGLLTLTKEFQKASLQLAGSSVTWQSFFEASETGSLTSTLVGENLFLHDYKSYVSIDMQFWGRTLAKGKSLVGWVESRCISLVVGMYTFHWPCLYDDSHFQISTRPFQALRSVCGRHVSPIALPPNWKEVAITTAATSLACEILQILLAAKMSGKRQSSRWRRLSTDSSHSSERTRRTTMRAPPG